MFNTTSAIIPTFLSGPDAYQSGPMLSALKVNWSTGNFLSLNFPLHRLKFFNVIWFLKNVVVASFVSLEAHCLKKKYRTTVNGNKFNAMQHQILSSDRHKSFIAPYLISQWWFMTSLFYNVLVLVIMCGSWSWPTSFPWSPCATHIPGEN